MRQGLKVYSEWPTYPQLYVRSKLIGGIDVVTDMLDEDEPLAEQLELTPTQAQPSVEERIKAAINASRVMLFMKGSPQEPQCGFSRSTCQVLAKYGTEFGHFDILSDQEVRQGIKVYSNWPTFPQLYVSGNLVGGIDIVNELDADGELADVLAGEQ